MNPIELQIFYLTEDQSALVDVGIDVQEDNFDNFELRDHTFYQVATIAPYRYEGQFNKYSKVFSNGEFFICNLPYQELKKKLEE